MNEQNDTLEALPEGIGATEEIDTPTEESAGTVEAPTSASDEGFDPLEILRCELAELKSLIVGQKQAASEPVMGESFRALYPEVAEGDIPDAVWEAARGGLPLEAAYALHERREALRRSAADEANRRNAAGAWGRTDTEEDGFLSPDEVRQMSPSEVRANYARITASMKHWT